MRDIVISFIGEDRPGLVQRLSDLVARHGGNWEESRMVQLAGHFAGSARIRLEQTDVESMKRALEGLSELTIIFREPVEAGAPSPARRMRLNIVGPDRPAILRDVANALNASAANVVEMETRVYAAPMSGAMTFAADAEVDVPATVDLQALAEELDAIANKLGVEILLEEEER